MDNYNHLINMVINKFGYPKSGSKQVYGIKGFELMLNAKSNQLGDKINKWSNTFSSDDKNNSVYFIHGSKPLIYWCYLKNNKLQCEKINNKFSKIKFNTSKKQKKLNNKKNFTKKKN